MYLSLVNADQIKNRSKPQSIHPNTRVDFLRLICNEIYINQRYTNIIKSPMQIAMVDEFGEIIPNFNPYKKYEINDDMLKAMYDINFNQKTGKRKNCKTCEYVKLFENSLHCTFFSKIWFETDSEFTCKKWNFKI